MDNFFQLRDAKGLFAKLTHDLEQLQARPNDVYAAFNFFVTAEHLVDWLHPGNANQAIRSALRAEPLLAVVSHLANGAKHFRATRPYHKSVRDAKIRYKQVLHSGIGVGDIMSFQPRMRILTVELDGEARRLYGDEIHVRELAEKVYERWKGEPALA